MPHVCKLPKILLMASMLLLCACVIKSNKEIIRNKDSEMMFGGARNLLWVAHDHQKILLEKYQKEFDRTYLASSLDDPSESVIVRFYKWKDSDVVPNEDAFIVSGTVINKNQGKRKRVYYYQLLTFDPAKNVWTTWSYEPPDDKEIVVTSMDSLKKSFKQMVEKKYFMRQQLLAFKVATDLGPETDRSKSMPDSQGGKNH